jgi:hypothetical protein
LIFHSNESEKIIKHLKYENDKLKKVQNKKLTENNFENEMYDNFKFELDEMIRRNNEKEYYLNEMEEKYNDLKIN